MNLKRIIIANIIRYLKESHVKSIQDFYVENNINPDNLQYLGKGDFGTAYSIGDGRVLKETSSKIEFNLARQMEGKNIPALESFAHIYKTDIINGQMLIILEELDINENIDNLYYELEELLNEQGLSISYVNNLDTSEIEIPDELKSFISDIEDIVYAYRYFGIQSPDIKPENLGYSKNGKVKAFDIDVQGFNRKNSEWNVSEQYVQNAGEIIDNYTHYKVGDQKYVNSEWAKWFLSQDRKSKDYIAYNLKNNKKLRDAMLSNWYDDFKKTTGSNITYDEFLNTEIVVYRGETSRDLKYGEATGFLSYTPQKELASKFAKDGGGRVIELKVKPKDTYEMIDSVGNEKEVIIPSRFSNEFIKDKFEQHVNNSMLPFEKFSEDEEKKWSELEQNDKYEELIEFIDQLKMKYNAPKNPLPQTTQSQTINTSHP